jgi:hypothetical protein
MPDVYTVAEAAERLEELFRRAAAGEVIIRQGPGDKRLRLAEDSASSVPPHPQAGKRVFGQLTGKIQIADDLDETPEWLIEASYHSDDDEESLCAPPSAKPVVSR